MPKPKPELRTYTVIGVWDHEGDTDTDLIIAAVIEGDHRPVDDGEGSEWTRYATVVQATDPVHAESLAGLDVE